MTKRDETDRVRVRSCGLVVRDQSLLMVKLDVPTRSEPIWMPPGGELNLGESLEEAVSREVREETGITVRAVRLSLVQTFVEPPWHAIEFYFLCNDNGREAEPGSDPEYSQDKQILKETTFIPFGELPSLPVRPVGLTEHLDRLVEQSGPPLYLPQKPI